MNASPTKCWIKSIWQVGSALPIRFIGHGSISLKQVSSIVPAMMCGSSQKMEPKLDSSTKLPSKRLLTKLKSARGTQRWLARRQFGRGRKPTRGQSPLSNPHDQKLARPFHLKNWPQSMRTVTIGLGFWRYCMNSHRLASNVSVNDSFAKRDSSRWLTET